MIALITSCINPVEKNLQVKRSHLNVDQRITQTIHTINKLADLPFSKVYLLDNSLSFDFNRLAGKVAGKPVIRHLQQYQFTNKGVNELLLLLSAITELPDDESIFKISGRYYPNENFVCDLNKGCDFKFKDYDFYSKRGTVSTRAYFVKNKLIYEEFLLACLTEVFSYPKRIMGPRSAFSALKQMVIPEISGESNTSIEFATARVLKGLRYRTQLMETIGIEGQIAGFEKFEIIKE
ncbi:MAG: hypothetical protein JWQ66_4427 [Mucilaginibacter sp.]|nr:hypothetical protein [Mucilaginibacter sp.]